MGPLFSIALLIFAAGLATIATFLVTLFFLPVRLAVLFSPVFVGAGIVGCLLGFFIQLPFLGSALQTSFGVWRFLGIIGMVGCASSFVASATFLRLRREIHSKLDTATDTKLFD